ncbi:MAG: type II secretion system F family protein [Candidatus Omnitrophota bacterium]
MPRFVYTAKTEPQKIFQGDIEAESKKDAIQKLTILGYFPISVESESLSLTKQRAGFFQKISRKEVILFTSELATLIESGVDILKSLTILSTQTHNKHFKIVVDDVISKVKDGKTLSESFRIHPRLFSNLYVSMIHSGEVEGHIDQAFRRLADFLEKEEEFQNSIRTALTYPLFVLILSIITIIVLLGFVIPKLSSMFTDFGQILPLSTKILMAVSDFLCHQGWLLLIFLFILFFLLQRLYHYPQNRVSFDRFKLKMPVLGKIILKTEISRLMRTLSLLLSGGTPIVSALDIGFLIIHNRILKKEIQNFKDQIARGMSFSQCLKGSKFFPDFAINIVTVGEESGMLEKSLLRIADDYEKEVDRTLNTFIHLLEPAVILIMGLVVGFIVISMLLPIFQISIITK